MQNWILQFSFKTVGILAILQLGLRISGRLANSKNLAKGRKDQQLGRTEKSRRIIFKQVCSKKCRLDGAKWHLLMLRVLARRNLKSNPRCILTYLKKVFHLAILLVLNRTSKKLQIINSKERLSCIKIFSIQNVLLPFG